MSSPSGSSFHGWETPEGQETPVPPPSPIPGASLRAAALRNLVNRRRTETDGRFLSGDCLTSDDEYGSGYLSGVSLDWDSYGFRSRSTSPSHRASPPPPPRMVVHSPPRKGRGGGAGRTTSRGTSAEGRDTPAIDVTTVPPEQLSEQLQQLQTAELRKQHSLDCHRDELRSGG